MHSSFIVKVVIPVTEPNSQICNLFDLQPTAVEILGQFTSDYDVECIETISMKE